MLDEGKEKAMFVSCCLLECHQVKIKEFTQKYTVEKRHCDQESSDKATHNEEENCC